MDNFHKLMGDQAANPHLMTVEGVKRALKSLPEVDTTRFKREAYQGFVPKKKLMIPKPTQAFFDWLLREPEKGRNIDLSMDNFYASLPPENPYHKRRKFASMVQEKEKENLRVEEQESEVRNEFKGAEKKAETTLKMRHKECMPGSQIQSNTSRVMKENALPLSAATHHVNEKCHALPSAAAKKRELPHHPINKSPDNPFKKKNTTSKMAPMSRSPSPCEYENDERQNNNNHNSTCLEPLLSTTFIVPEGGRRRKTSYATIPEEEEEPSPRNVDTNMISSPAGGASSHAEVASSSASSWSRPPHKFPTTTTGTTATTTTVEKKKECSKSTDQHAQLIQRHEPSMTPDTTEARDEPSGGGYSSSSSKRPHKFLTSSASTVETKECSKQPSSEQVAPAALRHQNNTQAPSNTQARDEHVPACSSTSRCPPQIDPFLEENDNPERHTQRAPMGTPHKKLQKQEKPQEKPQGEAPRSVTPAKSRGKNNLQPKQMDASPKRRRMEEDKTATPPAPTTPVRSVTPVPVSAPTTPVHSQKYDHVKSRYLDHVTTEKNQKIEAGEEKKRDDIKDNGSVTPTKRNRKNGFESRKRYRKTPPAPPQKKYVVTPSTVRGEDENTENLDKKDIMSTSAQKDINTMNEDTNFTISSVQQISENSSIHVPPKVSVKAMMNKFENGQKEKRRPRTPPPPSMPKNAAEAPLTPKRRSRTPPLPKNAPEALSTPKGRPRAPPPKINTAAASSSSSAHPASASESSAKSERRVDEEKREEKNRVKEEVANKKSSDAAKEEGDEQNTWGFLNCVLSPPREAFEKENLSDIHDKTPPTTQAKKGPQKQIWDETKNLKGGRGKATPVVEKTRFRKTPPAPKNTYLPKERSRTPPSRKIMENHSISGGNDSTAAPALSTNDERPEKKGAEQDHDDNDDGCTDKAVVVEQPSTSPLPSLSKDPKKPAPHANPLTLSTFKDYEAAQKKKKPVKEPAQENATPRDQMTKMKKLDARHSFSAMKMKNKMQTQMEKSQTVPAKKMQTQMETPQVVPGKKMQTQMEKSQAVPAIKMQTHMETSQAVSGKNAEISKKDKSTVKKNVNERKKTPRSGDVIMRPPNSSRKRPPSPVADFPPPIKESQYFVAVTENSRDKRKVIEIGQGFLVGRRRDYAFDRDFGVVKEYRNLHRKLRKHVPMLPQPMQNVTYAEGRRMAQEKERWFHRLHDNHNMFADVDSQTIFGLQPSFAREKIFPDRYAGVKWTDWTRDRLARSEVKEYKRSVGHTKQFRLFMDDVVYLREKVHRASQTKRNGAAVKNSGNFLA